MDDCSKVETIDQSADEHTAHTHTHTHNDTTIVQSRMRTMWIFQDKLPYALVWHPTVMKGSSSMHPVDSHYLINTPTQYSFMNSLFEKRLIIVAKNQNIFNEMSEYSNTNVDICHQSVSWTFCTGTLSYNITIYICHQAVWLVSLTYCTGKLQNSIKKNEK